MKKHILDFIKRGFVAMGFGPIILAIIYAILGATGTIETIAVGEVVLGVLSISLMAFIAASITVVYQIESLPLIFAILLHGIALYLDYAIIYLVNGWLAEGSLPFLIFTTCFVVGYAVVWAIVYLCIRRSTDKLNKKLIVK